MDRQQKRIRTLFFALMMVILSHGGWALAEAQETVTGTPTFVRQSSRTEVIFQDLPDKYWIREDRRHNGLMRGFEEAAQKKSAVTFLADQKSHQVLQMQGVHDPALEEGEKDWAPDPKVSPSPTPGASPAPKEIPAPVVKDSET